MSYFGWLFRSFFGVFSSQCQGQRSKARKTLLGKFDRNLCQISAKMQGICKKNKEDAPKGGRALRVRPPLGIFFLYLLNKFLVFFVDIWHKFLSNFPSSVFRALLRWPWHWPWPEKTHKKDRKNHPKMTITP